MKIPFYRKIVFKVFVAVIAVLSLSFSISYFVTTKFTNSIIDKNISKEFSNAINVTENFIKFVGQTSQIWAKHAVIDNDLHHKILKNNFDDLDEHLKIEKEAMSADSIILLDKNAIIISQNGSNYTKGDSLSLQDIVKETFKLKLSVTKISRERESFIIYSSALIENDNQVLGMVLMGYFINDVFLENIKINSNIEIAFVGNSAIMSSTKWGGKKELDILPMEYMKYQSLLKNPENFKKIDHLEKNFIVSARKLHNLESSISGSILVGHSTKDIETTQNNIFYKTLLFFSSIFILTLIILLYLSNKVLISINILQDSTQQIMRGDFTNRVNIKTNDEFKQLANNFNDMIEEIEYKDNQLKFYTIQLEDEIRKRTEELVQREKALLQQSKMASMGEMLENIAHQWRQPLSIISTAATGIKMQKDFGISDEKNEIKSLIIINDSAQHLSQTIDDFRNFFKSNKDKNIFNIKDIYFKTFNIISSNFNNQEIEIIDNLEDIEILSFSGELTQVIMNILNNAKDILETTQNQRLLIFVNIYKDEKNAIIKIKDNGGGIPKDIIDNIFEPYFTTKHKAQGTGIGLYMCEEMITKHMNGTLNCENLEYTYENINYTGACFTISLPIEGEL